MREEKRRLIHLFLQILFTTSYPFALFVSFLLVLGKFGLQFDSPFKLGNFRLETIQLAFRVDKLAGIDARHKVAIDVERDKDDEKTRGTSTPAFNLQ